MPDCSGLRPTRSAARNGKALARTQASALGRSETYRRRPDESRGLLIEEMEVIPEGKCSISIGPHIMTAVDIRDNFIHKILIKPDRV